MTTFEMIKYHNREYPADVPLRTEEIAAHFDITSVKGSLKKSLHTEYGYGKRKFLDLFPRTVDIMDKFPRTFGKMS